jgi:hypothetical protein
MGHNLQVRKRVFLRHFILKMIILPRQARDKHNLGKTQNRDAFSYSITCRTAWGCGIVFIIYAALTCQGGPLTRFLTWSFWTPFARLTYCWYLLHPLLMQVIYESNRESKPNQAHVLSSTRVWPAAPLSSSPLRCLVLCPPADG